MKAGTKVEITGARRFTGTVVGANDLLMIVADGEGRVYIRRDPGSREPDQWRISGMPVEVRALATAPTDFGQRLAALEERTRK